MTEHEKVNILLVDDQPGKLFSHEVVLAELGENLLKANSAHEAFEHLLRTEIAVVLVYVCMPDLDGFELAKMVRGHPRFQQTAIILISAVLLTDLDFLRGYEHGAVDYVSVPVVPEVLRAKVKVFVDLYRKTKQLELLNRELEERVAQRTAALEGSTAQLRKSEERLRLAFDAADMGWWDYDVVADQVKWSPSLIHIMGYSPERFGNSLEGALSQIHPDDRQRFLSFVKNGTADDGSQTCEFRFMMPDGGVRWSLAAGQMVRDADGTPLHFSGIDLDITERKLAEERNITLVRELDHRAKNLLGVVQSIIRLSQAESKEEFVKAVDGRIRALSRAHSMLSEARWQDIDLQRLVHEEVAPFEAVHGRKVVAGGPPVALRPETAQPMALALHELVTNAAKYGALATPQGRVSLVWALAQKTLVLEWVETGGPAVSPPSRQGFGTKVISGSIEHQLDGSAEFDWQSTGLRCTLTIPFSKLAIATDAAEGRGAEPAGHANGPIAVQGDRLLVVEDEPLVGLGIKAALVGAGFVIVGPIGGLPQALAAAEHEAICGAVLDVNLGGTLVYPVADTLRARGIPFVFLTGYTAKGIDRRYAGVRLLEKPIDEQALRQLFVIDSTRAETQRQVAG